MLSPDNFVDYLNALDDNNMPGKENAGFAALVQNLASTTSDAPFDGSSAHYQVDNRYNGIPYSS